MVPIKAVREPEQPTIEYLSRRFERWQEFIRDFVIETEEQ
jgi:hypothetical protein